jgi:hypothetical protein
LSRVLPVALVQSAPHPATAPLTGFAESVADLVAGFPQTRLVALPELHLCGTEGSPAYGPDGTLAASYRKVFPWRPFEPYRPGDRFVVFDVPDVGRLGFSICYDAWFPEVTRHLAWMGAEVVVNPVKTTTGDRAQELVLARANAIVNQVYVLSVNAAAPDGAGRSLVVDPEGLVRTSAPSEAETVLTDVLDLDAVTRVRTYGTAGLNRMWSQFTEDDAPLDLPLYQGRLDPARWRPATDD